MVAPAQRQNGTGEGLASGSLPHRSFFAAEEPPSKEDRSGRAPHTRDLAAGAHSGQRCWADAAEALTPLASWTAGRSAAIQASY